MGRVGKNISAEIKDYIDQTIETRLNYNQTARTFGPSGDDSPPVKDDRIVVVEVDGTGKFVAVGTLTVSQGAKPGEKILFSRNDKGEVQAVLSLLNDGKVTLKTPGVITAETDDAFNLKTKKEFSAVTEDAMTLESKKTLTLKGQKVDCNGTVSPTGSGPFCGITVCPFTGAPHVGPEVTGA